LTTLLRTPLRRRLVGLLAVAGLSLLITRAFGVNEFCPAPGPTTGYGYGPSVGYGYDFGYGYGAPCPTPTPTLTVAPTATPTSTPTSTPTTSPTATATVGTITLLNSAGNATTTFRIGEAGTAVLDALIASVRYDIDFAQSPGVIIGAGTTDANGDARIAFRIPTTAAVRAATLTFLPNGSTTNSRVVPLSIVAAQVTSPRPTANATATAVPVSTIAPTAIPTTPTLPRTGSGITSFLLTALALLALGTVLKLAAHRRLATVTPNEQPASSGLRTSFQDLHRGLIATTFGRR
jgi:hypothetical protein